MSDKISLVTSAERSKLNKNKSLTCTRRSAEGCEMRRHRCSCCMASGAGAPQRCCCCSFGRRENGMQKAIDGERQGVHERGCEQLSSTDGRAGYLLSERGCLILSFSLSHYMVWYRRPAPERITKSMKLRVNRYRSRTRCSTGGAGAMTTSLASTLLLACAQA